MGMRSVPTGRSLPVRPVAPNHRAARVFRSVSRGSGRMTPPPAPSLLFFSTSVRRALIRSTLSPRPLTVGWRREP